MSWIQKLYETYGNCQLMIGNITNNKEVPLLPICHTTQKAQIEIVIDSIGNFKRARIIPKEQSRTIIPCTEESGGRTSGEAPHPLCDKLQYVAEDYVKYGGNKDSYFAEYRSGLEKWRTLHLKAHAVFEYIKKGRVIEDLIAYKTLIVEDDINLLKQRNREKLDKNALDIFDVLPGRFNKKKGEWVNWQAEALIRWEVEIPDDQCSKAWEDKTLWESWIKYYSNTKQEKSLCYVTGKELFSAEQHPAKLRNDGDKAKLISSNDASGFTFRGRFEDANQACSVGFEITQKAHSALRWLISRQGKVFFVKGDGGRKEPGLTVVAWATSGKPVPRVTDDSLSILGFDNLPEDKPLIVSTAQDVANRFKNRMLGYASELGNTDNITVIGLDSASKGRLAITYYREDLTASDFLKRIEGWHKTCEWIHEYRYKDIQDKVTEKTNRIYQPFVGAPAPINIAEAAYGSKVNDRLKNSTIERLLPCIIDGQKLPGDIVDSVVRRACNRAGMDGREWIKTLTIACALYKKFNEKEGYSMALDENRKTRDYLYGRLLAAADCLERFALFVSEKKRDTNAARMMQRFSDRPCNTWKNIELSLIPYKARLGGRAKKYQDVIDEAMNLFEPVEDFTSDKPLSGEFLLGYHCQREALKPKENEPKSIDENNLTEE